MGRVLFSQGARGYIVRGIQSTLEKRGFDPKGVDGHYGGDTSAAVRSFQVSAGLPSDGMVTEETWSALMAAPPPQVNERALQLTSSFEGHGYTLAQGNWDGAWLTWGIVGFTMKYGQVQKILRAVRDQAPGLLTDAFGDSAAELLRVIDSSPDEQRRWADSVTVGSRIAEPWNTGFHWLGDAPEVQEIQRNLARNEYYLPSVRTAKTWQLKTELGGALCFDIHVQNGGIKPKAAGIIKERLQTSPPQTERDLRVIIAESVADAASARFRGDVLGRKLVLATGKGTVHGAAYQLDQFGLGEVPSPDLQ